MILYLLIIQAVVATDASAIQVTATPRSGAAIVGAVVADFKMDATFGTVQFEPSKLSEIQFGSPNVVTTSDFSVVRGRFKFEKLTIRTDDGEKTFPLAQLKKLLVIHKAIPVPGQITNGRSANGLTYHLRVPGTFQPEQPLPAIVILHGSNMNSRDYVKSIVGKWPEIAKKYIVIGINGERRSRGGTPENPRFNYTYINFVGKRSTMKGYPGTDRESPVLVKELVDELRRDLPIERLFIGGHSQGAFLTYSALMNFPESFDGAFPISGGLIIQAEPTAFKQKEIRKAQRERPIAIVHGTTDTSVRFSMSQAALAKFHDEGFPRIRLFDHKTAGHRFVFLPVDKAIHWLDEMTSKDGEQLVSSAAARIDARQYRDALALLDRAAKIPESDSRKIVGLRAKIGEAATPAADTLRAAMTANTDGAWVDDFLEFRAQFEFTEVARPVMKAYNELRLQHQPKADEMYKQSRVDLRARRRDDAYSKYQEVVDKYYASSRYATMKRWLAERED